MEEIQDHEVDKDGLLDLPPLVATAAAAAAAADTYLDCGLLHLLVTYMLVRLKYT